MTPLYWDGPKCFFQGVTILQCRPIITIFFKIHPIIYQQVRDCGCVLEVQSVISRESHHALVVWHWYHWVAIAYLYQRNPRGQADVKLRLKQSDTNSMPLKNMAFFLSCESLTNTNLDNKTQIEKTTYQFSESLSFKSWQFSVMQTKCDRLVPTQSKISQREGTRKIGRDALILTPHT